MLIRAKPLIIPNPRGLLSSSQAAAKESRAENFNWEGLDHSLELKGVPHQGQTRHIHRPRLELSRRSLKHLQVVKQEEVSKFGES